MKIIYRYIVRELIAPFLFGVAAFTGIFIGTDLLFTLTRYYNEWGVELLTLIQLFFLNLPEIIVLTFPMATLLAVIMAFGRLSGDGEITALRAGGVSIYKLVIPALVIGLLMTGITIAVNELVVPAANYLNEQIVWEFKHGEKLPATQENLFLTPLDRGRPDYVLYTRLFDGDTGIMHDVIFQDYEEGKPVTLIEAEKAVWSKEGWEFLDGQIYYLKAGERIPALKFARYDAKQITYTPRRVAKINKKIDEMNIRELKEYIEMMEEQGRNTNKERVKFHQRLAIPFASFIFALLAAPLGIQPQRSGGSATGLGLSIIVIFIYYSLMTIGSAMGEQGSISPFLGAWLQNFVFLIIGGVLLYRVGR